MKHHCPMCGEQWNEDKCASCGWYEGKQPRYSGRDALDAVADVVLAYRPKAHSKPAVRRKREANKIAARAHHVGAHRALPRAEGGRMSWAVGYDSRWARDIGYGVPAYCDSPDCWAEIDRGLAYVCCDSEPYGGERGCGLYFCGHHMRRGGRCRRCAKSRPPYKAKADHPNWTRHKATDPSWEAWRKEQAAVSDRNGLGERL